MLKDWAFQEYIIFGVLLTPSGSYKKAFAKAGVMPEARPIYMPKYPYKLNFGCVALNNTLNPIQAGLSRAGGPDSATLSFFFAQNNIYHNDNLQSCSSSHKEHLDKTKNMTSSFFDRHSCYKCHFRLKIKNLWHHFKELLRFNQLLFKSDWPIIWKLTYLSLKLNNI